jgi:hypothetical protein
MRGAMIALHTVQDDFNVSETVISGIGRLIQDNLDRQRALTGFVNRTLYLGSRIEYAQANPTIAAQQKSQSNAGLFTAVFASVAGIAILLACAALILHPGHRRKAAIVAKNERRSDGVGDVETPDANDEFALSAAENASATVRSTTSIAVKSIGSSTTILVSNKGVGHTDSSTPDGLSMISTASTDDSAESDGAIRERPLTPTRNNYEYTPTSKIIENESCSDRLSDPQPAPIPPPDLPPLAPTLSSTKPSAAVVAALSSTRLRRKKKRRKTQKLTRVSSRENVQGMETIAEAEEAEIVDKDGDDEDDDGSEYSYSTSETDGSHSRDPSPSRRNAFFDGEVASAVSGGGELFVSEGHGALARSSHSDKVHCSTRPPRSPAPTVREHEDERTCGGHEC